MMETRGATAPSTQMLRGEIELFCSAPDPDGAGELGAALRETRRLINLLELRFARTAARFASSESGVSDIAAEMDAVEWMRQECHMTSHAARTALHVGEHQEQLSQSIRAVTEGGIGMSHLGWMADTAHRLNTSPTAAAKFDEASLLPHARRLSVQRFRRQCEHLIHRADHEEFLRNEVNNVAMRRLRVVTYGDGSVHLDGLLDAEGGAAVCTALAPLARRSGAGDHRSAAERNADALIEMCGHLLDGGALPQRAGQRPHLHVTTTLETLLDVAGATAAEMESGALLSGTSVQRLACDGTMVRVLVNTESMIVDVGRARRVVGPATRRALNARDGGCAWPGCDRTASWTQAHHLIHWSAGGPTDLNNLVLLCHRHHWMVHEGGHVIVRNADGEIVTFAPLPGHYPSGRDPDSMAA
jgi:Domain of unknown function (DUF222)/HNH endonuclease